VKISVIVPCYNAASTIANELQALATQQYAGAWEVIVVDNGSQDQSIAVAESFRKVLPNFRIIKATERRGVAYVRNAAARAATGEALIFCDADDEAAPGFLTAMSEALQHHDFVACRFEGAKLNKSWIARGRAGCVAQQDDLQRGYLHPTLPYAGGGGLGVKKSVHESVGGFDESLLRQADSDYCFRVQMAGVPLYFAREAVYHVRWRNDVWGTFQQAWLWAEYAVSLRRRYMPASAEVDSPRSLLRSLLKHLIWKLIRIRSRSGLAEWIWLLGSCFGLLQGTSRCQKEQESLASDAAGRAVLGDSATLRGSTRAGASSEQHNNLAGKLDEAS
jgi:glycosyltransferase involved in cell wall biosynthesis